VYATPGVHNHDDGDNVLSTPGLVNDYTDEGHIWDPIQSAYWYKMSPVSSTTPATNGTGTTHQNGPSTRDIAALGSFTPYNGHSPVGFLYFKGRWGDYQFADDDPRQEKLEILSLKFYKWVSGPEGPAFKNLARKNPWQADHGRVLDSL
jgi:hypothetical protein